ncbi:helix-turn-helix transcriptional regulator [Chamaesiphon sp. VAR_48_metabat_135_sub]|uniref:helix-turn-helix transcriptional regulator n=1 Tax=Chamaesiphon sp. VAR_48_metabat_135_sub TaxID=2964699 RepID=UPI00286A92C2|nr:helix-turn-helix transcriptional regulator [Chamaesiphon sp. VAR_48_metabat_135_sub]
MTIHNLYTLKNADTFGTDSLAMLVPLVPADASVAMTFRGDFTELTVKSLDPDLDRLVEVLMPAMTRYTTQSPFFANIPAIVKGTHKASDFIDFEAFSRREIYTEVMKSLGSDDTTMLILFDLDSGRWPRPDELILHYAFYHPWQKLSERDRLILNLLQPHLIQAYQNICQYQQFQQQLEGLQQSLDRCGVILVDDLGRVQLMTAQAATWLQLYFPGHRKFHQLPELLQSWVRYQIDRLKSVDNLPSPQLPLRFQQENRQLTMRLTIDIPGKSYLLFFAEEAILSILAALELLGLTQREAEILAGVIHGRSNQDIATDLQMSINTVRKHLEHIYRKLGVQSRTEAISVALGKLGGLNISLVV